MSAQDDDHTVLHQDEHEALIDSHTEDASTQVHIPNAVASVAAPTKAEFDALVAKFNLVLGVLRDTNAIPSS